VETVRDAAEVFLDALKNTGSTARVLDFGTVARQTAPADLVTTASMQPGGVHANAIKAYYNPQPPIVPPTEAREYRGSGSITAPGQWNPPNSTAVQYTNWDQALDRSNDVASNLVVFVTDGDPTAIDLNQPGDAFPPDPLTVGYNTFRGDGTGPSVDRAVQEANLVKGTGARMLAVGVGAAVTQPASLGRLVQVSGPQVVRDASTITSLNQVDVAVVPDFEDLADLLRTVVTQLCSPSLTIRKFVQTAESTDYVPSAGWDMTVEPTVAGGTYTWIQPPPATPLGPRTVATNAQGFANFQWEPNPPTLSSTATVTESVQGGYTPGPARCEIRHPDDSVDVLDFPSSAEFTLPVGPEDIVTCSLRNNFDYNPGINIEKTPDPVLVRGDNGGTAVTYTAAVTNTGNTPLTIVDGNDTNCHEIEFVGGDANGDGLLDLDETWTYECTRVLQASLTQDDIFVDNTAFVNGVAPNGELVTDDDDATVQVLTPAINLEKVAEPTEVASGTPVAYTFTVTNLGNDPLSDITLTDDQCGTPTFVEGDDNEDGLLDLAETWTYTCTNVIVNDPTINQAEVTGTPTLGPDVSDPADAEVNVVYQDLQLTKTPSANLVFAGEEVTYTYVLSNVGEDPLTTPAGVTHETAVADDACTPVAFQESSGNLDDVLEPGESWTYTCTRAIDAPVLNTGAAVMVGPLGPLTRLDRAFVVPLTSGIAILKTPSDDLVRAGDPVTYTYEVSNTGQTPLAGVADSIDDDFCPDVSFVGGDTNEDGLLDVDEVFEFTCTTPIEQTTTNTVTVDGIPTVEGIDHTGEPVHAEDTAVVETFDPDISLVKSVDRPLVPVGTPVTFTFVATNTGDSDLVEIALADDGCVPTVLVEDEFSEDGIMQAGESWTWTCTKDALFSTLNQAGVVGYDLEGEPVTAIARAEIAVFTSEINLTKDSDPVLVPEGGSTTFTFTVTNPSIVPLSDITLTDDTCSTPTFVGGDTNGDDILAPNEEETWTYTCTMPIDEVTVNTAEVTGTDPGGGQPTDTGFAGAVPYRPAIAVVKTASPTEVAPGGTVTYTYQVTNPGNIPLADVANRITDDKCSPVTYVSGDLDGNGLLTPELPLFEYEAETWIFTCTTQVFENTTNTVVVTGVPSAPDGTVLGDPVSASATATVTTGLAGTGLRPQLISIGAGLVLGGLLLLVGSQFGRRRPLLARVRR
jgi:uncharacterized repeat protein (TIGR01451 family)